ncbi:GATA type zinc finger [Ceratobasidium sp. AG-Ba]|nr:GATA type zinc finger [Ceratobasidium sp. AG-Ba]
MRSPAPGKVCIQPICSPPRSPRPVCTKVAAHLEQGQRLENLSWRLWHLHNLMVDSDADNNTKARREFKRLSRHTGERLDRDKNRDISDLQAPKFTSERLRQRAEEKERCRLASEKTAHAMRGRGMKGMQYTFALKPPAATATTTNVTNVTNSIKAKPTGATAGSGTRPRRATDAPKADTPDSTTPASTSGNRPRSSTTTNTTALQADIELPPHDPNDADVDTEHEDFDMDGNTMTNSDILNSQALGLEGDVLRFETLFSRFGPNQLLVNPLEQSFTQPGLSYGEADVGEGGDVAVGRPTFEIQLEELLSAGDEEDKSGEKKDRDQWSSGAETAANADADMVMGGKPRMSRTNTGAGTGGLATARGYNTATMGVIGLKPDADSVPLTHAYAHTQFADPSGMTTTPLGTPTGNSTGLSWVMSNSPPLMPVQSAPTSPAFALRPVRYNSQQENSYGTGTETYSPESYDFSGVVPPLNLPGSYTATTTGGQITSTSETTSRRSTGSGNSGHNRAHSTGGLAAGSNYKHPTTININTATNSNGSKGSTPTSSPTSGRYDRDNGKNGNGAPSATPPPTRGRSGSNALPLHGNTAPGGVKSECANCGANSTPLWRRGLNDELNCNACGLYCKLHKRPRPKTLRNSGGEGGSRNPGWHAPRSGEATESMGEPVSCYNCHTTATPLWRKDEEGRTLCNACGLYLKLHGERRPSSMKSDVIRKRSRHDARRSSNNGGGSSSATPSASPGASRRASPSATSPTNTNDTSNQFTSANSDQHMPYYGPYDYAHASNSGMMGADEQGYPMTYGPSSALMFHSSSPYPGQATAYPAQQFYGPFLPNMMDTSGGSPDEQGNGTGGGNASGNVVSVNSVRSSPNHVSNNSGTSHPHKKRRMSTADTLASSTSGSERSDGTPSFLDDLANPNVPDPSRASPSFVPNYQYTSFSPSLTYPNLPGTNDSNANNVSYFHPPMSLPWLHNEMLLTNVGAKSEPVDEPMTSGEISMS